LDNKNQAPVNKSDDDFPLENFLLLTSALLFKDYQIMANNTNKNDYLNG